MRRLYALRACTSVYTRRRGKRTYISVAPKRRKTASRASITALCISHRADENQARYRLLARSGIYISRCGRQVLYGICIYLYRGIRCARARLRGRGYTYETLADHPRLFIIPARTVAAYENIFFFHRYISILGGGERGISSLSNGPCRKRRIFFARARGRVTGDARAHEYGTHSDAGEQII